MLFSKPKVFFRNLVGSCWHHMPSAMDASWSEFFSELLPVGLHFLTTTPRNAKTRLRRYAVLLLRSPLPGRFFLHCPGIDSIGPSSALTTAPRLQSIATKTPPDVCLRWCCARCKPLTFLDLSVELFLHFLLLQSVLHSKKRLKGAFVSAHVLQCAPQFFFLSHFIPIN